MDQHGELTEVQERKDRQGLERRDFRLLAVEIQDWNRELSPWAAPAVFGKEGFAGGGRETLQALLELCRDREKEYIIGGYSLAGLFALWAAWESPCFSGVAAASPSLWFPGFSDYLLAGDPGCRRIYLSLGDREERTRNPVMATVGERIRELAAWLPGRGVDCRLEWNPGNHFQDPALRTAKAFAWVLSRS